MEKSLFFVSASEKSNGRAGGVGKVKWGPEVSSRTCRGVTVFMGTNVFDSVPSFKFQVTLEQVSVGLFLCQGFTSLD